MGAIVEGHAKTRGVEYVDAIEEIMGVRAPRSSEDRRNAVGSVAERSRVQEDRKSIEKGTWRGGPSRSKRQRAKKGGVNFEHRQTRVAIIVFERKK